MIKRKKLVAIKKRRSRRCYVSWTFVSKEFYAARPLQMLQIPLIHTSTLSSFGFHFPLIYANEMFKIAITGYQVARRVD